MNLPDFRADATALDYSGLRFNPCNDLIFPSVVKAADHLAAPLDNYYMYYAPHNEPGGICLATAPSLDGPWTEYPHNPLIANAWPGHYSVSHVSSPDVIWVAEESKFFLFYHGENTDTRTASSADGVHFEYEGVAVRVADLGADFAGAFYARAFRHSVAKGKDGYVLLFVGLRELGAGKYESGLYVAESPDARHWRVRPKPAILGGAVDDARYSWSPFLFRGGEQLYLAYHVDFFTGSDGTTAELPVTDIYGSEISDDLTRVGEPRLLLSHQQFGPECDRVADPYVVAEGNQLYMFTAVGPRLNQYIGLAKARL